ncbi:hypothetical protein JIN84_21890 [Luteolibacter yonseiensis]|uniref:Uncharacterized protein n=1 Tax=Luteolibacter yonseiensis TaxID=1144680 RepID=A0A934VCF4_9BACT|nr:hypothetical protein [Luteolibacter yonseiensis]MBK1818288.1 hypothetical protein [Luteolibacter yonseiensis]
MHPKKLIPILLACLTVHSHALTPEATKAGEELAAALQEEIRELGPNMEQRNRVMTAQQYLRVLQSALGQQSGRELAQALENFDTYEAGEKVNQCATALRISLNNEDAEKTKKTISEMEAAIAAAAEAVTRAENPEDLDKIIGSLSRATRSSEDAESYNNPAIRKMVSEIGSARQFAIGWQDYLQASKSGNAAQAVRSLNTLATQNESLIPRSRIIARLTLEQADEDEISMVLDQVKKLDDMKEAIRKLGGLLAGSRNSSSENPGARETLQTLVKLEKTYRDSLAGLPVNIEVLQYSNDSSDRGSHFDTSALRAALLVLVLPRVLELPAEFKPGPGETVDAFLARAISDANHREDSEAAMRIEAIRLTLTRSSSMGDRELEAARDYSAGVKQVKAKQYMLAVVSLQKALKSGSDLVPAGKAGELLDSIRKDHPKEFEEGMMEFLTPRATPEYDYSRMPYRNYLQPGARFRDGDPRAQGGTTIVLPVPGKEVPKETTKPAAPSPAAGGKPPEPPAPVEKKE